MIPTRTVAGPLPRALPLPVPAFWRAWAAALLFAALALGIVTGAARADEDAGSPQAFWRAERAPDAMASVRQVGRFARDAIWPVAAAADDVLQEARRWLGRGNVTGSRGPWCADFATMVLRRTGHHTVRSRLARDAVRAGRPIARPVPGAIMSLPHHTGFVVRVVGPGRVLLLSGNHGHRVGLGVYSTRGARFALPA